MDRRDIWMTDFDLERLRKLLEGTRVWSSRDREHLERLDEELARAHVVSTTDIPPEAVTINSRLRLRDLDSGQDIVFPLVFPSAADSQQGKVSVLVPLGTAVLGFRRGDAFTWRMPGRVRWLQVKEVLYLSPRGRRRSPPLTVLATHTPVDQRSWRPYSKVCKFTRAGRGGSTRNSDRGLGDGRARRP